MPEPIPSPQQLASRAPWRSWLYQPLLLVFAIWVSIFFLSVVRYQPPAPRSPDIAATEFSAGRAETIFRQLFADHTPHPADTPPNAKIRQQIVQLLESFGYTPQLQPTSAWSANPRFQFEKPVPLTNIIALRKGTSDKPPVMLAAHFDSHPNAPGASDDGAGVAVVLEIARMLQLEPAPARDIVFLLTDGEEYGLIGASRFVEEHPLADEIAAVINLEARGTRGPSLMFETGSDSWWLITIFARIARRPFTSSLFYEIYKRLPNDTDFTVFKEHGMQGYNFAYIGDVKNYHTPNDSIENTDRGSLQHHGDQALALIRALARADIEQRPAGRAVYFDVLGWRVIYWPESVSIWLAVGGMILCLLAIGLFARRYSKVRQHSTHRFRPFIGALIAATAVVGVALLGAAVHLGFSFDGALDNPFPDFPLPVAMAHWLMALAALVGLTFFTPHWIHPVSIWIGTWSIWSILAIVSSLYLNGGCYLFVVPVLAAGLCGCLSQGWPAHENFLLYVMPAVVVGLIWLPMEVLFYDAVGYSMNPMLVARVALVLSCLLPALFAVGRLTRLGMLLAVGMSAILAVLATVVVN